MDSWLFFLLLTIIGWVSGVLVNYISETIPYTRSFRHPVCEECENRKAGMSFGLARRCHYCGAQRRFSTLLVEKLFRHPQYFHPGFNPAAFGITLFRWLSSSISGP